MTPTTPEGARPSEHDKMVQAMADCINDRDSLAAQLEAAQKDRDAWREETSRISTEYRKRLEAAQEVIEAARRMIDNHKDERGHIATVRGGTFDVLIRALARYDAMRGES